MVGHEYSRADIAQFGHVSPLANNREWSGIVEFANCVLLFCTLDKTDLPDEHHYSDFFNGQQFDWESQNQNTQGTPVIETIAAHGSPVHLFCRVRAKHNGRAVLFVYVGEIRAKTVQEQRPVRMIFDVLQYQHKPNAKLAELYSWKRRV